MSQQITFIGGGNMASAMVAGLLEAGTSPCDLRIVEPGKARRLELRERFEVGTTADLVEACRRASIIVLAVKPDVVPVVAKQVADAIVLEGKLVISIAAGTTTSVLEEILGEPVAILRAMPNTPATFGLGATGFYANRHVSAAHLDQAMHILSSIGLSLRFPTETQLDAVTAVSGSGPAYFFLLMEEMVRAGQNLGLAAEDARRLTLQTALGAARMAADTELTFCELRQRVTSPGGTTHAAVSCLQQAGFGQIINEAMTRARDRAIEMGRTLA